MLLHNSWLCQCCQIVKAEPSPMLCVYYHPPATYSILYMDTYFTKADVKVNPAKQAKCGHVALYDLLRNVVRCDSAQYMVCFLCRII